MTPSDGSHFAEDWLKLREPVDHRSRAHDLAALSNDYLRRRNLGTPTIVDLGAGRGSNLRYLQARLDGPLRWRLVDSDPKLLAAARTDEPNRDTITTIRFDLSAPLEPVLAGAALVTASALIDLASADWIDALCEVCLKVRAAVLIALTIDGRVTFTDPDPGDELIRAVVDCDQRRDKGLGQGPALGAHAPAVLADTLAARGYAVTVRQSDWQLDAADAALARALIAGWQEAAQRQRPRHGANIAAWARRRTNALTDGRVRLTVGHVDVLGLPNAAPPPQKG